MAVDFAEVCAEFCDVLGLPDAVHSSPSGYLPGCGSVAHQRIVLFTIRGLLCSAG